jgi:pyruvate/2-oxoglutarate dehydrogenase complex dihydrolipoamide acyltransferase (E2) component
LIRWLLEDGAPVVKGTPVVIVASEGAAYEVRANGEGSLRKRLAFVGQVLEEGTVLATIGADGENIPYGRPYSTCEPLPTAANPEDFDLELDAEVAAGGRAIQCKADEALQRARAGAKRSILFALFTMALAIPFVRGMPLNTYFFPWGQITIAISALALVGALVACSGFAVTWFYQRRTEKLLRSMRPPE